MKPTRRVRVFICRILAQIPQILIDVILVEMKCYFCFKQFPQHEKFLLYDTLFIGLRRLCRL